MLACLFSLRRLRNESFAALAPHSLPVADQVSLFRPYSQTKQYYGAERQWVKSSDSSRIISTIIDLPLVVTSNLPLAASPCGPLPAILTAFTTYSSILSSTVTYYRRRPQCVIHVSRQEMYTSRRLGFGLGLLSIRENLLSINVVQVLDC